jgi:hypothetical protein
MAEARNYSATIGGSLLYRISTECVKQFMGHMEMPIRLYYVLTSNAYAQTHVPADSGQEVIQPIGLLPRHQYHISISVHTSRQVTPPSAFPRSR